MTPRRTALLVACGFFLIQFAWILAVPPFRAIDEFDHVYRAAAVAHGQWTPSERPVTDGRGDYVTVPRRVVEAAGPVCRWYDYTGPDNCRVVRTTAGGLVEVASAAARYNPAFYWIVSAPSSSLDGTNFLYALRVASSALCALLLGASAWALATGFRSRWPLFALIVVSTPVLVYSTTVPAPNGIEMTAGLLAWCCGLALRQQHDVRSERLLLVLLTLGACCLAFPRLLGPLWVGMILGSLALLVGPHRWMQLRHSHPRLALTSLVSITTTVAAGLAWSWLQRPNRLDEPVDESTGNPVMVSLSELPLWVLQSIATGPTRNEPAPTAVYAIGLAAFVALFALVGRHIRRRQWALTTALVVAWLGVQLAISISTVSTAGTIWQGRYALAYGVGPPLVAAAFAAWNGASGPSRIDSVLVGSGLAIIHVVTVVAVARGEAEASYLTDGFEWWPHPAWILMLLASAGSFLMSWAAWPPSRTGDAKHEKLETVTVA